MRSRTGRARPPLALAASDLAAIVVFVTIGLISHHKGFGLRGYARDTLPLAGGWLAAALLFHPYREQRRWRTIATWALGVPLGVLVRALVLGRSLNGSEAAFLAVCLVTIGLLVAVLRRVLLLGPGARVGS
jgi:hypothetical protein